jgi:hypothetical protein
MHSNFDKPRDSSRWRCGAIYIESSKGTSHWAGFWTPDNVRAWPDNVQLNRTKSGSSSWVDVIWVGLDRTMSVCGGQCPMGSNNVREKLSVWMFWSELEFARTGIFYFIIHTPLNSMMFLYSRDKRKHLEHAWALLLQVGTLQLKLTRIGRSLFLFSFLVT